MATIGNDPNGHKRILFVATDGKRKTIRLGKVTMKQATSFKVKLEALIGQTITGVVDDEVSRWLAGLDAEIYSRLAAVGLVPKRASAKLGEFMDRYIAGRQDTKALTRRNMEIFKRRILRFFDSGRNLRDFTQADADAFLVWLKQHHAESTAGRTIKQIKQFFRAAVRGRIIRENPFADVNPPSEVNEARKFFVTREVIQKVLDACPDAEWRLLIALSRYGGLRCPSEHLALVWAGVNWEKGRFLVDSPKTGPRWVPIFPELRSYLEDAWQLAEAGAVHVITRYRDTNANLRTQFYRIIKRAGVKPWPKLFHNLRANRETELAADYPLHVVCEWIGNSALIAQKHYLQVTEANYEQAAQIPAQSATGSDGQQGTSETEGEVNVAKDKGFHPMPIPARIWEYAWRDSNPQPSAP
jgi:integrase